MKIKILDQVREYDAPVTVYDAARDMELITRAVIGAQINGETVALTKELTADAEVKLLTFEDAAGKQLFRKPAACVVNARRGGCSSAFDRLNKYFTLMQMPVVTSTYWNSTHGTTPDEVKCDLEGMQVMRNLGNQMAWLLKCIEAGKEKGIERPGIVFKDRTNFIR